MLLWKSPSLKDFRLTAMDQIRTSMTARTSDLRLYLDYNEDPAALQHLYSDPNNSPIMIFLKWFDVQNQTLRGVSKVFVGKNQKVSDLHGIICELMHWAPTVPLKLYEVSRDGPQLIRIPLTIALHPSRKSKRG